VKEKMAKDSIKVIAQNKKARHEYFIEETYEAGIELTGTEVKSIRQGRGNLRDSYAYIKKNLRDSYAYIKNSEVFIRGMHISPYEQGNIFNTDPLRDRKLLLHKREINKLIGYTQQKGLTLIPTKIYFKNSWAKIELAVARGKKLYDKRRDIAERHAKLAIDRKIKEYNK